METDERSATEQAQANQMNKQELAPKDSPEAIASMSLSQKLRSVCEMCDVMAKTKSGYNFKYVPEEEVLALVTSALAKYRLNLTVSMVPGTLTVEKHSFLNKKKETVDEVLVKAEVLYVLSDCDNPTSYIEMPWAIVGQMPDASQAFGSAWTYCNRYFLLKLFQIASVENDPDSYRSKQRKAEERETNRVNTDPKLKKLIVQVIALCKEKVALTSQATVSKVCQSVIIESANPNDIKDIETAKKLLDKLSKIGIKEDTT